MITHPSAQRSGISSRLTLVLAVACGVAVGNLYYAQPVLHAIAHDLHVGSGAVGLVVTLSQLGYALGLVFVVPLGDLLERRRLVVGVLFLTTLSLLLTGLAPSFAVLAVAITAVGITTVIPQILVPLAASLASPQERGRVVGRVMSGLLVGVLLARTIAGLLAAVGSWRVAYLVSAGLMVVLAGVLRRELPQAPPSSGLSYPQLLRSVVKIVREEPAIRRRSLYGALGFACFSAVWTSMAFLLSGAPYHYGLAVIGLFGLLGVAGALMANRAGHLADAGRTRSATGTLFALLLGSFGLLALGRDALAPLIAGILVLDLATQGIHILNQATIYARRSESRGRVTTIYMTTYFLGGAAGSAASSASYAAGGWGVVCLLGALLATVALVLWALERRVSTSTRAEPSAPVLG